MCQPSAAVHKQTYAATTCDSRDAIRTCALGVLPHHFSGFDQANDKVAGLDLKASSEASPFTSSWSYENVTLDVTVASSTIYSSSAQKMAEVTVTSSGIPQDIVEYANDQVSAFSESHIDMFSLSTNVIKYTVGTDAAPEDAPTSGTDMDANRFFIHVDVTLSP